MRIGYVIPSMQKPSGWRSHAVAFINHMRPHVQPVLFVSQQDEAESRAVFPDLPVIALPTTQRAAPGQVSGWRRLLACYAAVSRAALPELDLVHSLEAYPTGLVGHWLARRLGRRHVLTAHGTYSVIWVQNRIDAGIYSRVLRQAALVCPVSHGTADQMRQHFASALATTPVRPVLNGNDFYQRVDPDLASQRMPAAEPLLLSVGEVKERKGYHTSLLAFAEVKKHYPSARYVIVGQSQPSPYLERLQDQLQAGDLSGVEFVGAVSPTELDRYFRQAWVFLLTPEQHGLHFEGFGLVYLEAGAYGLPVVGTRTGGVPDAVHHGETGLLVPQGDARAAAESILSLLDDSQLRLEMGRNNRRLASRLTWERNAQETMLAYESLGL